MDQVDQDKIVRSPDSDIAIDVGELDIVVSVKFIENSSSSLLNTTHARASVGTTLNSYSLIAFTG